MTEQFPVLYILARTDLPSMNAGKLAAQASHASNAFINEVINMETDLTDDQYHTDPRVDMIDEQVKLARKWQAETPQAFGTVLVLAVTEDQMRAAVQVAQAVGLIADTVNDPTYPYIISTEAANLIPESTDTAPRIPKGDQTVMFRSEDTVAFIGGDKNDPLLTAIVGNFPLHP